MSKRILVVEDERLVREQIARTLELRGFSVESCDDGLTALTLLSRKSVDLILVDFVMPRLNGYHFVRTLEAKKMAQGAPIILMSALTSKIKDRFGRVTGVRDYLEKPFTAEQLVAMVDRHLGREEPPPEEEVEVDLDEPLTMRDEHWMLVAQVRETLQGALSQRISTHIGKLKGAGVDEDVRHAVARLLDDVFDEQIVSELVEIVQHYRER